MKKPPVGRWRLSRLSREAHACIKSMVRLGRLSVNLEAIKQEQREWQFPVFILVEPDDVERVENTGLLNLKLGFAVEVCERFGKSYACMFTSRKAIDGYVRFFRCPTKQIVEIENAHDFIRIFGKINGPEVPNAVIDFAGDENRFAIAPIGELLDLMRRMVADQLGSPERHSGDLSNQSKRPGHR